MARGLHKRNRRWLICGIGLAVCPVFADAAPKRKCTDVADRALSEAGFPTVEGNSGAHPSVIGAALELARERYRTRKLPEYRWLDGEPKPKSDSAELLTKYDARTKTSERAVLFASGDEGHERITQISIQGKRFGTSRGASTLIRFNEKCQVVKFVTDPQDLGYPTRELELSPKTCRPVFQAEAKKAVPGDLQKFTLAAAKQLLPSLSGDDPTLPEALEVSQDSTYISVVFHLYQAKLALCREWEDAFYDPAGQLAKWKKPKMKDRAKKGFGGSRSEKKASGIP
jgi:hypothetical protein